MFIAGASAKEWRESENSDIWQVLWDKLAARSGRVCLYCVKAHAAESEAMYLKYQPSAVHVVGNACADMLADFGARLCGVEPKVTDQVLSSMSLVHLIQKRMVAIIVPLLVARPKIADDLCLRLSLFPLGLHISL